MTRNLPWTRTPNGNLTDQFAAYQHLRLFESDYDKAQGLLRTIASAWLLAGIGAVGFLAFEISKLPSNGTAAQSAQHIFAQLVIFGVQLGFVALWRIDQGVYQRLLHTVFVYGIAMEARNQQLPQIRSSLYAENADITHRLSRFYIHPIYCAPIPGGGFFIWATYSGGPTAWWSGVILIFICVVVIVIGSDRDLQGSIDESVKKYDDDVQKHFIALQDQRRRSQITDGGSAQRDAEAG